jgi:hypothetical protein
MSDNNKLEKSSRAGELEYSESFLVQAIEQIDRVSSHVKVVARTTSIELQNIRPREVQALMDEIEARIEDGSLF